MATWISKLLPQSRRLAEANTPWYNRRVYMLSRHIASAIPGRGTVLDIGPGDGQLGFALTRIRPDLKVEGLDVAPHPRALIPVIQYDGLRLPLPDRSVDYAILADVLHQTADPAALMFEAGRVVRHGVVIKDYLSEGILARPTLLVMDWLSGLGEPAPAAPTYLSRRDWQGEFFRAHLQVVSMAERLNLHLPPAGWLLDRHLHFVAYLTPKGV